MRINDWDIAEANARQLNVVFGGHAISNYSDWAQGAYTPVVFRNMVGFKTIDITLLVKGDGREEILRNRSTILSKLLEPCSITLDRYKNQYFGIMKKFDLPDESSMERFHRLKFSFDCYEYGAEEIITMDGRTQLEINNPGNLITPIVIEVTPKKDEDFEIKGVCRKLTLTGGPLEEERNQVITDAPLLTVDGFALLIASGDNLKLSDINWENDLPVKMNKMKSGKRITVNGENGLITEDGSDRIPDVELWELPTLLPGLNIIAVSDADAEVVLRYCPRYM